MTEKQIRLVGNNVQNGIITFTEAEKLADQLNLDLIKVSDGKDGLPIYKIIDEQKFLFEKKKQDKEQKSKNKTIIKEIRITPCIGEKDLLTKINHAIEFGEKGYKIKFSIFFKGREITVQKDEAKEKMDLFIESLKDYYILNGKIIMEGKRLVVNLNPKKEMKEQIKLIDAMINCYQMLYLNSTPQADFLELMEKAELNEHGQKVILYNDYEIDEATYDDIVNKIIKSHKISKHDQQAFKNAIALGCSPKFKKI